MLRLFTALLPCLFVMCWHDPVHATKNDTNAARQGPPHPRIALVLSGGGARGGAHIGVLRVLEELRVPVDIIVGTSAGSIVGAAYASGLRPDELEQEMQQLSTATLFRDASRADEPLRRKAEDGSNYIGPEFGLRGSTLSLPKGAISGVALEAVLRRLTRRQQSTHFDELPIRFRAVATDLATGDMVVLDHGSLASAVRASMAVPGAVNPIEIDGRLLVDGGLTRNLPVDVARHLGADAVIAVNIGTPLLRREELTSFLSVSEQMLNILTEANVRRSMEELGPRDVLIQPRLDGLSAAAFDRLPEAVRAGVDAAHAQAEQLRALSVSGPAYAAYAAALHPPQRGRTPLIDEVNVLGTSRVNPAVVRDAMRLRPGSTFDTRAIDADIRRIYGRGDFESVNYDLTETETGHALNVHVTEKSWGPNYVRFGLSLSSDFSGDAYFNLLATHRMTWLNRLGAEWHSSLQIGRVDRLRTEWYQPIDERQRWFVAPGLRLEREPFDVYDEGGQRLFGFRRATREASLDLGVRLGQPGELRVGLMRGAARVDRAAESTLPPDLVLPRHNTGGVRVRLAWDELDSLRFPRSGLAGTLNVMLARPGLGATDAYNRWEGDLTTAMSRGPHALSMGLSGGGRLGGRVLPIYEQFPLGGFLNLSGYRTGQLYGDRYVLGRAVYTYRLAGPAIFDGAYVGASYELGRIGESFLGHQRQRTRSSMALFLAVDTPLGPVYLGYGRAQARHQALYFFLGVP